LEANLHTKNRVPFDYHRLIVGYHGCDRSVVEQVLLQGESLRPSDNLFDWLGKGVYFWEYAPQRALEFAREQQQRGKVETPAVLGVYLHLGRCFDLNDTYNTAQLSEAFVRWEAALSSQNLDLPENRKVGRNSEDLLLRFRDCALLNWYMDLLDASASDCYYQTVRGVFVEGGLAYPGAAIHTKTHTQIAVRDLSCILGYFLPNLF
jgi:hypothetical protein